MRRTLIVGLGTAACGAVLHFRRRREADLRHLTRRLARASTNQRPEIEQRIAELRGSARLLAFDLDGTDAYRLPPPLESDGGDWRIGEAQKLSLHPRDVLDGLQSGLLPEIDQVNPATLRGLDADNASGGARPNADLAFQAVSDRVKPALRDALVGLLTSRQALTAFHGDGIRVFVIAGTFGGTGSGSYDRVRLWLLETADELGVRLDIYPFLLLPGAHVPKDPSNSYANTFAVMKELAADATGFFWRPMRGTAAPQRSGFRAPFLLSDTNNSPGAPRIVSETAFGALVGEIIYELTATALGAHLDAQMGDFGVAGVTPTLLGEPRQARSIGFSTVFLDMERQELFSRSILAHQFVSAALKAVSEGTVRQDVRAFLEGSALVLGDGRNDLADRLLEMCTAREKLSLTRLRSLFNLTTENLHGIGFLAEGRNRLGLALQQCGDFGPALQRHAAEMIEGLGTIVSNEIRRFLCDASRGPASAGVWLAIAGGISDAMLAAAGSELGQVQGDINELDGRIHRAETQYAEELREKGPFYRALHSADLSRAAAAFRADLEAWAILRVRSLAVSSAIQVLNRFRQAVHEEMQATIQPILTALAACVEGLREDRMRAVDHSVEFGCPNGLPLLANEADLADLHARWFSKGDEAGIVGEFFACLGRLKDPAAVLRDSATLTLFLEETAPQTLLGARLEEINVIDELRHRFPDPVHLGSVLRERDIEAYERLPLVSTSNQTSGLTLVRLLGIDGSRLEAVRALLEKHQSERGGRYIHVDTSDRQRLAFMQVRAVFPFSDWRGIRVARTHYEMARFASETEKQHVLPGNRFLPTPGTPLSEEDVAMILFRAWLLDRLEWRDDQGWTVLSASNAETPATLGLGASIPPQLAYRLAVDMVSSTSCFIRRYGPGELRRRLGEMIQGQNNNCDASRHSKLAASAFLGTAVRRLQAEADWWERNAHPTACGWTGVRLAA